MVNVTQLRWKLHLKRQQEEERKAEESSWTNIEAEQCDCPPLEVWKHGV